MKRVCFPMLLALSAGFFGCVQLREAWDGQHPATYIRAGERTEVRLISWADWPGVSSKYDLAIPARPQAVVVAVAKGSGRSLESEASALASQLVGLGVAWVQSELEKEADRHDEEYASSTYAEDYWEAAQVPKYAAFEVVRFTSDFASEDRPASRLICALVPAKDDRRLLIVRPVYYVMNAAAARVSRDGHGEHRVDISCKINMSSIYVGDDAKAEEPVMGNPEFVLGSYDLDNSPQLKATWKDGAWTGELGRLVAGYAVAPAVTAPSYKAAFTELDKAKQAIAESDAAVVQCDTKLRELLMPEGATQAQAKALDEAIKQLDGEGGPAAIEGLVGELKDAKAIAQARLLLVERRMAVSAYRTAGGRLNSAVEAANTAPGGGVFSVKVSMKETDKSRVAGDLKYTSKFIGEHTSGLQEIVKDAVNDALRKDKKGDK